MKLHPNSPKNCISSGLSLKKRRPSSDRIGRRLTAMLLVTAMGMGMSVGLLASADDQWRPTAVQNVEEFPTLTIETNLVKSELTGEPEIEVVEDASSGATQRYGFVEVALRVKPGLNAGELIPFVEAGVALAYEKNILEPITWNYDKNGTEKLDSYDLIEFVDPTTGNAIDPLDAAPLSVNFPAKKADAIHTGAAFVGGGDADADGDGTADYVPFSLYAEAEEPTIWSGDRAPVMLEGDSRLVVVRFRYDANQYKMTYDETKTGPTEKIQITKLADSTDIPSKDLIIWANDDNAAASPMGDNAYYMGGDEDSWSAMYYIHSVPDPTAWTDTDGDGQADPPTTSACDFIQAVLPDTSGGTTTTTFSLREDLTDDPYYVGQDAYSVSSDTYTTWSTRAAGTATYSYTTNFFPVHENWCTFWGLDPDEPKIRFTQICALTADQGTGGISLDDIAVILFYDWDDTLLGTLLVPRGMDVREDVNAYVRENFIHEDLQYDATGKEGAANLDLINGTSRANSYRGTYPHDAPGDPEFSGNYVTDGGDYPLTNKLDYTFFKRPMYYSDADGGWLLDDINFSDGYDADYPYAYGWAVTTDPAKVPDLWSTLGTGELESYYTMPGYADLFIYDEEFDFFEFCDFTSVDTGTVYAKAIYEPGAELAYTDYTASDLQYTRYGVAGSAGGGIYSIQFNYNRVNENFGVNRVREPAINVTMTPDVSSAKETNYGNLDWMYWDMWVWVYEGFGGDLESFMTVDDIFVNYGFDLLSATPFQVEATVENTESIQVDITPSSGIQEVSYVLAEKYGYANFVESVARSGGDEFGTITNFDPDADADTRQGTDGFVFRGSLGVILQEGTKLAKGETNTYDAQANLEAFQDLRMRYTATMEFNGIWAALGKDALAEAISDAYSRGWVDEYGVVDLSWHQLQYYLINGTLTDKSTAEAEDYFWYRGPAV